MSTATETQPIAERCDGSGPHSGVEVRKYPMGDSNAILCRACAERERLFDVRHGMPGKDWNDLTVYEP